MAVYERTYKRYTGPQTPQVWRFLVLPRYAFKDVFKSRILVFFYAICFVWPMMLASVIYFVNNLDVLKLVFEGTGALDRLVIDATIFDYLGRVQAILALLLTIFIGPGLVSRDLANNGLPLYLSRPISRAEYVTGKISVLFILLSAVTWVPGLLLFGFQGALHDGPWIGEHLRIAVALVVGCCAWILLLALFAMAFSAWVKWRFVAAFGIFLTFIFSIPFSISVNRLFRTDWGYLINPLQLMRIVWAWLLGTEIPRGPAVPVAWMALFAMAGCLLFLLHVKLRAYEVVK